MIKSKTMLKRAAAFLLTLALVFSSGDFVPGIAAAIAEEEPIVSHEEQPDLAPLVHEDKNLDYDSVPLFAIYAVK